MRYSRNMNMLSEEDNEKLKTFSVAVIGCGGLGGYGLEMLARLGIGHIICVDGDDFDVTNLNRQLLSNESNLSESKASVAKKRLKAINSSITITAHNMMVTSENIKNIITNCDVVIDAVDDIEVKLLLEAYCRTEEMVLIYGAIGGWYGQVSTVYPGDQTVSYIYKHSKIGIEKDLGNPSFTPATIASIQVAECLKVLLSKENTLRKHILMIDLLYHDYELINL